MSRICLLCGNTIWLEGGMWRDEGIFLSWICPRSFDDRTKHLPLEDLYDIERSLR